ncbi:MAG TPA: AsmA-like C-terminal domain-containing protein [Alphaproteobacteria bacterium]
MFLEVLGALIVIATALVAIGAWRLSSGPISIGFLTPLIEETVNANSRSALVDIEDTVLAWQGWGHTLDIRAQGVHVRRPDGTRVADLPAVEISLSGRALLRGMVAPTSLEVIGARLTLTRTADGAWALPSAEATGDSTSALAILLEELLTPPDEDRAMGYLTQVRVADAEVTYADLVSGRVWRAPSAEFVLSRDRAGVRAEASLLVDIAGELMRLAATGFYTPATDRVEVTARTTAFQPELLGAIDPTLARLQALRLPISGVLHAQFDGKGRFLGLDFDFAGVEGTLSDQEYFPEEVPIRRLRLRGQVAEGLQHVAIAEATLDLGGPVIEISGQVTGIGTQPRIEVEGVVHKLPTDELRRMWPRGVGENARRWITENLSGGTIEETRFEIAVASADPSFSSVAPERVDATIQFTDIDVNYLSPMPKVRKVSGTGRLGHTRIDLDISSGSVGDLRVGEGTIAITGLDKSDEWIDIELVVRGPVRSALQLVDSPPLGFVKKIGLSSADFGGQSATRLRFRFPLIQQLKIDEIQIAAAASIARFSQRRAVLGQDATDGRLTLRLNQRGMDIAGQIVVAGVPAEVQLARSFLARTPVVGRTRVKATLDAAARRAFGLDFAPYIDGPLDVSVTYVEQRNRRNELVLDLALARTTLAVPELDWRKEAGTPGTGQVRLILVDERPTELSAFRVTAGDLAVRGRGSFERDGKTLRQLEVTELKAGLTDASGSYSRGADGIAIRVTGNSLNVGAMLRTRSSDPSSQPRLTITAALDRVYFAKDRYMDRVQLQATRDAERWETFMLQARAGGGEAETARNVGVSLRMEGGQQRLDVSADDAGALLKALDVTPNVVGGKLEINGASDPNQPGNPLIGKGQITNFRVVNAPVLARVLSVALLTGILDALRGEGIHFKRLDTDFSFRDPVIEVKNARASGAAIGITANGTIDTAAETIDLNGTIVPAYAINSLLGNIPVVGDILVGGKGGGLFAANYRVSGPIADANVSINPLSTLAPGFLRNLFGIFDGTATPGSSNPHPELGSPDRSPSNPP